MLLVGVNHCQHILHVYKILVHCYSIDEIINQFKIGYIINPLLHFNKVSREQFGIFLSATFHNSTMKTIKKCLINENTCFMELIMSYYTNELKTKNIYGGLSCVIYSLIDNYVCIDYLSCK